MPVARPVVPRRPMTSPRLTCRPASPGSREVPVACLETKAVVDDDQVAVRPLRNRPA